MTQRGIKDFFDSPYVIRPRLGWAFLEFIPNYFPYRPLQRFSLQGMLQFFVDKGLIAAWARFFFEVLNDSRIQIDVDALFERLYLSEGVTGT